MIKKDKKRKVFVGLSGGVDSSVSAAILKAATPNNFPKLFGRPTPKGFSGYDVVGVFIRTWTPEWTLCTWRDERRDAMRVAAHLGIPFLECDAEAEYKKEVADYMIAEYKAGRTPNPDVMCNREIKFGVFWRFAKAHGADFIATGHYAQNIKHKTQNIEHKKNSRARQMSHVNCQMFRASDHAKDQSYFLWTLTEDDLSHTLFPIGHLKKTEVRKLAGKFGLPTATKKDSQGICMLGDLDIKEFLSHYIKMKKGNVLDEKGEIIGHHDGAAFLTLGERHGFTITKKTPHDNRYYIVAKNVKNNTITVSHKTSATRAVSYSNVLKNIRIRNCNWISGVPDMEKNYTCQIRYHGEHLPCSLLEIRNSTLVIAFNSPILVASGQSVVIYDGDTCLGGGVVL